MEEFWSEEDLRAKVIVPYVIKKGFDPSQIELEKSFNLKVGTKKITVRSDVLLKVNGQPRIVIEVKRPDHKIDLDDAFQAISYARLCDNIAPLAIVTNLNETKIYDTITKEEVTTIASLTSFQPDKLNLNEEFKSEALKTLFSLNHDFLQDFCLSQRKVNMMHLLGNDERPLSRFTDDLYLNRKGLETDFENFLASPDKCFLIVGRQGTGKTFSMISLAKTIGSRLPVLFYDMPFVTIRIGEMIEEDFCWGSKQRTWYGDIINQIDSVLKKHNTQMVIFLDSINETSSRDLVKKDIIDFARRIYNTSIKLCIACRVEDWKFFYLDKGEPGIFSTLLHHPNQGMISMEEGIQQASVQISDFSDEELDLAFQKYRAVFDLKKELSGQARLSCKHPETLRMVSEIFCHKEIPFSLRRKKLLDAYWRKKVECIGNSPIAEQLLNKIGKVVLEQKNLEISEKSLMEMVQWSSAHQEVYWKAISENILVLRTDKLGERFLRISPNLILEYILAKNLLDMYKKTPPEKNIVDFFESVSQELSEFPLYEGSMLLFCSILNNPEALSLLFIEKFEPSKIIDQLIDETPDVLKGMLAQDAVREKIRRALLLQEVQLVKPILSKLLEKYEDATRLVAELSLSIEQTTTTNFSGFLNFIATSAKFREICQAIGKKSEGNLDH